MSHACARAAAGGGAARLALQARGFRLLDRRDLQQCRVVVADSCSSGVASDVAVPNPQNASEYYVPRFSPVSRWRQHQQQQRYLQQQQHQQQWPSVPAHTIAAAAAPEANPVLTCLVLSLDARVGLVFFSVCHNVNHG